jgi:uncharacterized Tic20 family protein
MKRYPPEPTARQGEAAAQVHHELSPAGRARHAERRAAPGAEVAGGPEERLAALCYLGVIFFSFLPALVIYLAQGRRSRYLRQHAARAVNLAVALLLFGLSAVIMGALLALDSIPVSLMVVLPLATALWILALGHLIRAAVATERGQPYQLPDWLCVRVLK